MARPLKGDQEQFDSVEMHVVTGEPRDVVRPNVGCGLGVTNLVPFGQSADRCRRLIWMGSVHLSPLVFIITHIDQKSTKTLYLGGQLPADLPPHYRGCVRRAALLPLPVGLSGAGASGAPCTKRITIFRAALINALMFAVKGKRQVYRRAPSLLKLKALTESYSLANEVKSRAQGVV
jgi:hypothetical protein